MSDDLYWLSTRNVIHSSPFHAGYGSVSLTREEVLEVENPYFCGGCRTAREFE